MARLGVAEEVEREAGVGSNEEIKPCVGGLLLLLFACR